MQRLETSPSAFPAAAARAAANQNGRGSDGAPPPVPGTSQGGSRGRRRGMGCRWWCGDQEAPSFAHADGNASHYSQAALTQRRSNMLRPRSPVPPLRPRNAVVPARADDPSGPPVGGDAATGLGPFQFTYLLPPDWPRGRPPAAAGAWAAPAGAPAGAADASPPAPSAAEIADAVSGTVRGSAWLLASLGESADTFRELEVSVGTEGTRVRILRCGGGALLRCSSAVCTIS